MDAHSVAFGALRELSACKHVSAEFVRGAAITALRSNGIDRTHPEFERLITEATPLIEEGLVNIGFQRK